MDALEAKPLRQGLSISYGGHVLTVSPPNSSGTVQYSMDGISFAGAMHSGTALPAEPGAIVVTGWALPFITSASSSGTTPVGTYLTIDPLGSGFNFNDGFGGAGGATGIKAGVVRTTAEGHTYIVDVNLDPTHAANLDHIVDYGLDHGYTASEIAVVATDAYYESGFRQTAANGSHIGLFQYDSSTWSANGEAGSITSSSDQIAAIFNDLSRYEARYTAAWNDSSTGLAAAGLSFGQYFEIKHELGNIATNWTAVNPVTGNTYISDWAAKAAALHIH